MSFTSPQLREHVERHMRAMETDGLGTFLSEKSRNSLLLTIPPERLNPLFEPPKRGGHLRSQDNELLIRYPTFQFVRLFPKDIWDRGMDDPKGKGRCFRYASIKTDPDALRFFDSLFSALRRSLSGFTPAEVIED